MNTIPYLLLFGSSESDSDIHYLAQTHIPDPLALLYSPQKTVVFASALEYHRLKEAMPQALVLNLNSFVPTHETWSLPTIIAHYLKDNHCSNIQVKSSFPVGMADALRSLGIKLDIISITQLPQREIKTATEIEEIRQCADITQRAYHLVETLLGEASIQKNGQLYYQNEPLTADFVRSAIENECFLHGAIAENTIVACGDDACDPHQIGHGVLQAHQFIVVDCFPYLRRSHYFSDVTRTFIKGKPNEQQRHLYETVAAGQQRAIDRIKNGAFTDEIMANTLAFFESQGYETSLHASPPNGMFHSLGHGIGIDIHEAPSVSLKHTLLRTNMVCTVEPGLYYRGIGGVRIEDDVLITDKGCEVITHNIPYHWIID